MSPHVPSISAEYCFVIWITFYTLSDHKGSKEIMMNLYISSIIVTTFEKKMKKHVGRMSSNKIPNAEQIMKYH